MMAPRAIAVFVTILAGCGSSCAAAESNGAPAPGNGGGSHDDAASPREGGSRDEGGAHSDGAALPGADAGHPTAGGACAPGAGSAADPTDLLANRDWSHVGGATVNPDCTVHMRPLGRAIVQQDGTGGQSNPPVAILGPRLDVSGDFEIHWKMSGVDTHAAYLHLYGEPPVIYDEWRQERHSIRFGIVNGQLLISIWDNTNDKPTEQKLGSGLSGDVTVSVARTGAQLAIAVNGAAVGKIDEHAVFASGQVWFGADAELGGPGWTLSDLHAQKSGAGQVTIVDPPSFTAKHDDPDALRNLASKLPRPILIGGALAANPLLFDGPYRALGAAQLSMLTPENDMKPQFVHPQPDVYEFAEADGLVAFAEANGIAVHAHTLVWKEALPAWMRQATGASTVQQIMLDHIDNVAGHFKGRVAEWDVINEPMADDTKNHGLFPNSWYLAMGEQYIDLALKEARKVDPAAKLFINEYGCEDDGTRWNNLLALVQRLKSRGAPLDGIGFQNHEYESGDYSKPASFRAHIQALGTLGIQVRVSEMDVQGSDAIQAREFGDKLRVCREEPNCTSFTTWGLTARYGSTADIGKYPPGPGPGVFYDEKLQPTAAQKAMQTGLK